jgi:hypothetical protein
LLRHVRAYWWGRGRLVVRSVREFIITKLQQRSRMCGYGAWPRCFERDEVVVLPVSLKERTCRDPQSWRDLWQRRWGIHSSLLIQTCVTSISGILLQFCDYEPSSQTPLLPAAVTRTEVAASLKRLPLPSPSGENTGILNPNSPQVLHQELQQ